MAGLGLVRFGEVGSGVAWFPVFQQRSSVLAQRTSSQSGFVRVNSLGGEAPTNGAQDGIAISQPYIVNCTLVGVADMLFHRWNCESVAEKAAAAKGSKSKKSDDVQSYVYRDEMNNICVPGEYLRQSIIHAAKFRQDPRSPRKSAMDLYKAGVVSLTVLSSLGKTDWDYLHQCRVTIQRNGITRSRPAIKAGWKASFQMLINLPEYIPQNDFHDVLVNAGRLIGLADFRPTYGRFQVTAFTLQGN
jgi:hypothetical protein